MFPSVEKSQLPKPRTHHDSSAVSACLKSDTGNRKKLEFKSKIPVRKPEMIGNRIESSTKPKWNSTTQVDRSAEIKPLPGIKKTWEILFENRSGPHLLLQLPIILDWL
jgi:hypothetical protein